MTLYGSMMKDGAAVVKDVTVVLLLLRLDRTLHEVSTFVLLKL